MDDAKHNLRIKYGLPDNPTDAQVTLWVSLTDEAVADGADEEEAGREAAFTAFDGVDSVLLFSAADTIQALLALARRR